MATAAIPPATPPAMAATFDELELLPFDEEADPDVGVGESPAWVDDVRIAVPVALAAVEMPEGPITAPGPSSGASDDVCER